MDSHLAVEPQEDGRTFYLQTIKQTAVKEKIMKVNTINTRKMLKLYNEENNSKVRFSKNDYKAFSKGFNNLNGKGYLNVLIKKFFDWDYSEVEDDEI